jgi:hypothetical protein
MILEGLNVLYFPFRVVSPDKAFKLGRSNCNRPVRAGAKKRNEIHLTSHGKLRKLNKLSTWEVMDTASSSHSLGVGAEVALPVNSSRSRNTEVVPGIRGSLSSAETRNFLHFPRSARIGNVSCRPSQTDLSTASAMDQPLIRMER